MPSTIASYLPVTGCLLVAVAVRPKKVLRREREGGREGILGGLSLGSVARERLRLRSVGIYADCFLFRNGGGVTEKSFLLRLCFWPCLRYAIASTSVIAVAGAFYHQPTRKVNALSRRSLARPVPTPIGVHRTQRSSQPTRRLRRERWDGTPEHSRLLFRRETRRAMKMKMKITPLGEDACTPSCAFSYHTTWWVSCRTETSHGPYQTASTPLAIEPEGAA